MKNPTARRISFSATPEEVNLIDRIANRAEQLELIDAARGYDRTTCVMDLLATNANGCPLDFARMLAADDFNFSHDISGIARHIDRQTGQLTNCFLPRFALACR